MLSTFHKYVSIFYFFNGVCLLLFSLQLTCQTKIVDSLKAILPSLPNKARIDCLNEMGSELSDRYWSKSKYQQTDTALFYTMQALNESQQLLYLKGIGKSFLNLGVIAEEHGNFKTAEQYTRKALPVLDKENMLADYHRGFVFLGWILHNRGYFKQSIDIYEKELPYYEAVKDSEHIAAICRITARAYDYLGNSEKAFTYFQKDFAIKKNQKDAWGKRSSATLKAAVFLAAGDTANAAYYYEQAAAASNDQHVIVEAYHANRAIAYRLQKKYDSALLEMNRSINIIRSSNKDILFRKAALMTSAITLGDLFLSLKQFDSAIAYSQEPLCFFKKGSYITALLPVLKTIASAHYLKKENADALNYTNQLLGYAQHSRARRFERDGYKLLWQIYTNQHKSNLANHYHLKYILLDDSLKNDKYISQAAAWKAINDINANEAHYQNQIKINEERHNAKLRFIYREKKTQLYLFIATIAFVILFTGLVIRNSWLKRKKEQLKLMITEANIALEKQKQEQEVAQLQRQKAELEMQALQAQMNPHFIFNCLNSINRFIIKNDAIKAADYLTKFAKMIRIVLEQSGRPFVPLTDELKCLQLYMDLEAVRFEIPFRYQINCNETDISTIMIPTLLIQPFVENAIWHGLHPKQNGIGEINIDIHTHDNILHCSIRDNGVGIGNLIEKNQIKTNSLGMQLTQKRLQLFNVNQNELSKIELEEIKDEQGQIAGTCVSINIPFKDD